MKSLDDLANTLDFTTAQTGDERVVTFLPEPERAERLYTVISVDDHIVEPPDTFEGRVPAKFADLAPKVIETESGGQTWMYDGQALPNVGFNAVVGRPVSEYGFEPARFDEMRRGAWDIHERVKDMDLNGVYASLNFPSFLPGFAGQRLQLVTKDRDLAMASVRAWNDWHHEVWAGSYPGRIIPCQLPWLLDPEVGAQMIRENAERGFHAVTFSENPAMLGLPSIHSGYWEPMMAACAETGTVVNLHIGSSGSAPSTTDDAPPDVQGVLFFAYAISAGVDWLYSGLPSRYPDLKICLSEGGIGWVAGLLDRLDHMLSYHEMYGTWKALGETLSPAEVFTRNFWFCAVEDQSSFIQHERIGTENIMLEADYPHCDSTWPHTQRVIHEEIGWLPADVVKKLTWENAANLYRHPVPVQVQNDPNAY
ncbi:amidohydrolase [Mycobacterium sp. CBMA271]|uniref:amidohydrolase family protein n=1 Tax=unclassified Mycobacteroides TaxID=2618759 RepID=UPI0012DF5745|nr:MULTISPECIES: amidohydrolase family protein [unclassified Mycobacteroides]MUM19218.1 amidohydrolase [Mycobacteroides sp. CBMA 326]MUM21632.1 amidohydrolase [Mycobacteroides sp. CBMA 271]